MKFYKYQKGDIVRYYKNIKRLCDKESLSYDNIYYSVVRLKKGYWSSDGCEVFLLHFS